MHCIAKQVAVPEISFHYKRVTVGRLATAGFVFIGCGHNHFHVGQGGQFPL